MIYFLIDVGPDGAVIDIGYSRDPEGVIKRFKAHTLRNPNKRFYCAVEGDKFQEGALHNHFAAYRYQGVTGAETYHATPELVRYVEWLGTQPWAACSLAEVRDPLAHWQPDIPWQPSTYTDNGARERYIPSLFDDALTVYSVRAPLPPAWRDVEWLRTTNDWYTPGLYVEAARRAMGTIDLDPASSQYANKTIQAGRIYTANDDGLAPSNLWLGNIWLNPPYGGLQEQFMVRLVKEYAAGNVTQAVACLNSWGSTARWFQPLWPFHICWVTGRVKFLGGSNPDDVKTDTNNSPANGTAFVYLGANTAAFVEQFDQFGPITPGAINRRLEVAA